jgi:hypothetical protein
MASDTAVELGNLIEVLGPQSPRLEPKTTPRVRPRSERRLGAGKHFH